MLTWFLRQCKKFINRNLKLVELGYQKEERSHTAKMAESTSRRDSSSSLSRTQPIKSHRLFLIHSLQLPFPFYKSILLLPCGGLHMAHHGCRSQTAILCWFWINPFCWRNTWWSICLWLVFWWLIGGPKMIPSGSRVGEPIDEVPITEPHCVCVCVSVCVLVTQLCPTLCNPMDCSPPGSFVHGILQARTLEWLAISFSKKADKSV